MSSANILFPVIRLISVSNYGLFPGFEGTGFTADFVPGVTIVVGTNGLGKTTLLNTLFRALSGPVDWKARPTDGPAGATPTTLSGWKTRDYFVKRVGDAALNATFTAVVTYGEESIELTRSFRDLRLTALSTGGAKLEPTEQAYQKATLRASGCRSFEDYFLLLRYLVFFLDDRQIVVWDSRAQFDLLRTLFFDVTTATRVESLVDRIQQLDSEFRNFRYAINKQNERLARYKAAVNATPAIQAEVDALALIVRETEERKERFSSELAALDSQRRSERHRLEQERLQLESLQREYERHQTDYFRQLFPNLDEVVSYLLTHVQTGGGCLVCGNQREDADRKIKQALASNRCPVCDSLQADREDGPLSEGSISASSLTALDEKVRESSRVVGELRSVVEQSASEWGDLIGESRANSQRLREAETKLGALRASLPGDPEEMALIESLVKRQRRELQRLRAEQGEAETELTGLLETARKRSQQVAESVTSRFNEIVRSFVADECELTYGIEKRRIGQEGAQFDFPRFTVRLASAAFSGDVQPRSERHEVSESQRQFIDLAFRIALLSVASSEDPSMMVLETPEATLDAVFIKRAGALLAGYASQGGPEGNRLIASTNLTNVGLIPALLGLSETSDTSEVKSEVQRVPFEERADHIVNLLDLAAPNAALKKFAAEYDDVLNDAVYPDLGPADGETEREQDSPSEEGKNRGTTGR